MHLGIVGFGSIGSVLAKGFGELGHTVWVNDVQRQRVEYSEYQYAEKGALASECDAVLVAVPTPTPRVEDGGDASAVYDAVEAIDGACRYDSSPPTVIIRSTMPPGTTTPLANQVDIPIVYAPEFLRDRSGVEDFFNPDRIVLSGPATVRNRARILLNDPKRDADAVIETPSYLEAELGKEAHNAFFATKVSFANQLRAICSAADADAKTVMGIVQADRRNGPSHLDPTLGPYGGKCLPKDLRALRAYALEQDVDDPVLSGTAAMNEFAEVEWEDRDVTDADQPAHKQPVADGGSDEIPGEPRDNDLE